MVMRAKATVHRARSRFEYINGSGCLVTLWRAILAVMTVAWVRDGRQESGWSHGWRQIVISEEHSYYYHEVCSIDPDVLRLFWRPRVFHDV